MLGLGDMRHFAKNKNLTSHSSYTSTFTHTSAAMITERTITRCTLLSIFSGLLCLIIMTTSIALPYWSTGTFETSTSYLTVSSSFHAGLFVFCPGNSTKCIS